jgi:hypothetical protein
MLPIKLPYTILLRVCNTFTCKCYYTVFQVNSLCTLSLIIVFSRTFFHMTYICETSLGVPRPYRGLLVGKSLFNAALFML